MKKKKKNDKELIQSDPQRPPNIPQEKYVSVRSDTSKQFKLDKKTNEQTVK